MRSALSTLAGISAAALSLTAFATGAHANTTIFDFTQGSAPSGSIVYTNTFGTSGTPGSTAIIGVFSATGVDNNHPYSGTFHVSNGYGSTGTGYNATLINFTGYIIGPVFYYAPWHTYFADVEGLKGEFQAVSPVSSKYNMITFDYSSATTTATDTYSGVMSWSSLGGSATLDIDYVTPGTSGDYASIFSSDFLDFSNPNSLSAYYSEQSLVISLSPTANISVNGNGTIASFTADPAGQFNCDPSTP